MKHIKEILKESVFGAMFTLWSAPIDDRKLDISAVKSPKKNNTWFLNNIIIGHKIGS